MRMILRTIVRITTVGVALALIGCGSRNPLTVAPETQINFEEVSAGLVNWPWQGAGAPPQYLFAYIDTFDTANTAVPYFYRQQIFSAYPFDITTDGGVLPHERVLYMRAPGGTHRLWFANAYGQAVVDTSLTLPANRSTVIYLVDSLATNYRAIAVDESTPGPADSTRIRVLNLSPDAGPIGVYVVSESGGYLWTNLPQQVPYGTASPYVDVDTSLVSSDGNVYLKFFANADTANGIALATVPFMRGHSYHVAVGGLLNAEMLTYPQGTAFTNPSIAARVRVTY